MIQRIQTLYLLIAFAAGIAFLFSPLASYSAASLMYSLKVMEFNDMGDMGQSMFVNTMPLVIVTGIFVALLAIIILLYKNRPLQAKLAGVSILINTVMIFLGFWFTDAMGEKINAQANYEYGAIIPVISLLFLFMAMRGIKKDEKLIRSMERLR